MNSIKPETKSSISSERRSPYNLPQPSNAGTPSTSLFRRSRHVAILVLGVIVAAVLAAWLSQSGGNPVIATLAVLPFIVASAIITVADSGNVAIGVTDPGTNKLYVNG